MRKLVSLTLASSAIVAMACGRSKQPDTSMSADLKRDLQLATTAQNVQINPDEVSPQSKQQLSVRPKAAPHGPKVVRNDHPTVKASAQPKEVAQIKTEVPQVEVMAANPTPSPDPTPDSPPLARPAPIPASTGASPGSAPGDGRGRGTGASDGSGVGSVLGGIFGAVIRGGMIGDDDHCDPRPRGRANPGDIYGHPGSVGIGGILGGMGGMGRSRFPR